MWVIKHKYEISFARVCVNDILSALNNDNISVLLLLDLSAAFDTLDHQILLSRLNSVFGIQSTALQWFHSYLSDRYQSTSVSNSSSSPSQLMYGVPQGSVLGPILFVLYTTPLSNTIANHSVNHQLFTDDTQLQKSTPRNEVTNLTKELHVCTDNIKTWMMENQLKLNDNKTEALLFPFSSSLKPSTVPLPDSITFGSHNIPFSDSARNLGFILDSKLSMKKHIIKICQTAYFELKRISSIHRFLTEDATKTLVTSYILSWLDYYNCLLMGTTNSVIQPLQKFRTLLQDLFSWQPVITTQHLSWKNCTGFPFQNVLSRLYVFQCYKWFWSCLPLWTAACLHSISYTTLFFWHLHAGNPIQTQDSWLLYFCFGPHIWNSLPQDLRHCSTLSSFKAKLKTFLFSQYFHPN